MKIQHTTIAAVCMLVAIAATGCDSAAGPQTITRSVVETGYVELIVSTAWPREAAPQAVRFVLEAVPCAEDDGFEPDRAAVVVPVKPDSSPFARVARTEVSFDLRAGCYAARSELLGEEGKRLTGYAGGDVVIELVSEADRDQGGEEPHRHIQFFITRDAGEVTEKAAGVALR